MDEEYEEEEELDQELDLEPGCAEKPCSASLIMSCIDGMPKSPNPAGPSSAKVPPLKNGSAERPKPRCLGPARKELGASKKLSVSGTIAKCH